MNVSIRPVSTNGPEVRRIRTCSIRPIQKTRHVFNTSPHPMDTRLHDAISSICLKAVRREGPGFSSWSMRPAVQPISHFSVAHFGKRRKRPETNTWWLWTKISVHSSRLQVQASGRTARLKADMSTNRKQPSPDYWRLTLITNYLAKAQSLSQEPYRVPMSM